MTREEILREATKCVCGHREQEYGAPEDNTSLIAKLWSDYTGNEISPIDVCMMMCMLKIARVKTGTMTNDSFVDICGYSSIAGEISSNIDNEFEHEMNEIPKISEKAKKETVDLDMPYIFRNKED